MADNPLLDLYGRGSAFDARDLEGFLQKEYGVGSRPPSAPREPNPTTDAMRWLAERIPHNGQDPRLSGSMGLSDMLRGALGSSANWLDKRPEIGSDTLAPLGLAAAGPLSALRLMEHPTEAAVHSRGRTFTGPTHLDAIAQGERHLGDKRFWSGLSETGDGYVPWGRPGDGFITSEGRFVSRNEADNLMRAATPEPAMRGESTRITDAIGRKAVDTVFEEPHSKLLFADSSRASLPGTIVNGLEQGQGPLRLLGKQEARAAMPDKQERMAEAAARGENWLAQQLYRIPASPPDLTIMRGDRPVGGINYSIGKLDPSAARIMDFWNEGPQLSVAELRSLREQFRALHPDVTRFEGMRVSGAKETHGHPKRDQSVEMKSDPMASLPGTVLSQSGAAQEQPDLAALLERYGMPR